MRLNEKYVEPDDLPKLDDSDMAIIIEGIEDFLRKKGCALEMPRPTHCLTIMLHPKSKVNTKMADTNQKIGLDSYLEDYCTEKGQHMMSYMSSVNIKTYIQI